MFPPQSTPSKRPKRRVESYRIYKRPYSACSQSSRPSPSSYEKATHGRLVGPTLSTPRGDNNYNQYRPLCEVCPRDRDKVVGTLQGRSRCYTVMRKVNKIVTVISRPCYYPGIQFRLPCTPPPRTIFHGCQIVHWDPLDGKRRCPKKNLVWAM